MCNCMFNFPDQMFDLQSVFSFSDQMQFVIKQFCSSDIAGSEKRDSQILNSEYAFCNSPTVVKLK